MAAFAGLDWRRLDVTAVVTHGGLATIDEARHAACRAWLAREGYAVSTFDCRPGLAAAIPELGRLLRWEEQFGYALGPDRCNLDAVRDGFDFDIPDGGGHVFEVVRPDLAWTEDCGWLCGLLSIAQEHTRQQLALGRRFFTLLVVRADSRFVGAALDPVRVPAAFWDPCREVNQFER